MGMGRLKGVSSAFKARKSGRTAGWLAMAVLAFGWLATYANATVADAQSAMPSQPGPSVAARTSAHRQSTVAIFVCL